MHPGLLPFGPGKPVRLNGAGARVMIIEAMQGRACLCSWMAFGKMYRDWFCITGLRAA